METKSRPILFNDEMVRAILDGRKTETRRVVKPQPPNFIDELHGGQLRQRAPYELQHYETGAIAGYGFEDDSDQFYKVPFGKAGDTCWVRECFAIESNYNIDSASAYPPPFNDGRPAKWFTDEDSAEHWEQPHYRATDPTPEFAYDDTDEPSVRWRPSIHMPRWASRITLEITKIRVERLQDITEDDATAEGVDIIPSAPAALSHRTAFAGLWNRTMLARKDPGGLSWSDNPWVWVIQFKRLTHG